MIRNVKRETEDVNLQFLPMTITNRQRIRIVYTRDIKSKENSRKRDR